MRQLTPPPTKGNLERVSNFELLRLISQFAIVLYHILMLFVYPTTTSIIYKALWLPLHVGVILFVLISGYFTIKPTSKGIVKLIGIFFVYSLPEVIWNVSHATGLRNELHSLLFLSNTHFWFIKTYLFLYLLSPIINKFLQEATERQLIYIVIVLVFICQYMATTGGDVNMADGKNVVNFILIYTVGFMLHRYQRQWQKMNYALIITTYILLNLILVIVYYVNSYNIFGSVIWKMFFPYSSIGLMLNSILVFIIVGKMSFRSRTINYMAKSSLAIYLLHENRPYLVGLLGNGASLLINNTHSVVLLIGGCILLALLTIFVCIAIDKMLSPIWNAINRMGTLLYLNTGI